MAEEPAIVAEDVVVDRVRRMLRGRTTTARTGCAECGGLQEHYAGLAEDIPQGGEGNE